MNILVKKKKTQCKQRSGTTRRYSKIKHIVLTCCAESWTRIKRNTEQLAKTQEKNDRNLTSIKKLILAQLK